MDINNLAPNSHKAKKEALQTPRLKESDYDVKVRKKSKVANFTKSVVAEDAKDVGFFIVTDVLLPSIKKLIVDVVTNGIHALIYGDSAPAKKTNGVQRISYNNAYNKTSSTLDRIKSYESRNRTVYDLDDIIFPTRGKAERKLQEMIEAIDMYDDKCVSVADLRSSCRLGVSDTDWNYGWTDLGGATVERTFDGEYYINLPKPKPIERNM